MISNKDAVRMTEKLKALSRAKRFMDAVTSGLALVDDGLVQQAIVFRDNVDTLYVNLQKVVSDDKQLSEFMETRPRDGTEPEDDFDVLVRTAKSNFRGVSLLGG